MKNNRPIYVVGHKNPDTDSICAAIAYAELLNKTSDRKYEARRAGHLNEETKYILDKFKVASPPMLTDVRTQVRDLEIRELDGCGRDASLKEAWDKMRSAGVVTVCITDHGRLEGLITTNDIVTSLLDVYDSDLLADARTPYKNIVKTLDGEIIVGDDKGCVEAGKVVVAAASPEVMENIIGPGDVVILGNRYETQLCAIEMKAACIIVCDGSEVARTIRTQAGVHGCRIITTPHDTFTASRLVNTSMPIGHFMNADKLISFHLDDYIEDIQDVMAKVRHRYFPVLDENDRYVGMISRRNFLGAARKQLILVDHNEGSQAVNGVDSAELLEIIDHHRLGTISTSTPVFFRNQPLGSTSTIIYQMYHEKKVRITKKIAGLLLAAILSDTLMYRSPTCTETDRKAGEDLASISGVDPESLAREMFHAGSNLSSKKPDEIIHQDFKKFTVDSKTIGIGQINSMSSEELSEIKEKIMPELAATLKRDGLDMVFFMLTNIIGESSEVVCCGNRAAALLENGFNVTARDSSVILKGVVSRKKQLLPTIVDNMES
ncbi:putative manganese-dependent inorganic diphosphatase [Butyrivibrio sp. MC2013]|uniref:putative manganese-dependent inorganic diphosphatase n=1 Tax=Butyrivibrio sp. MC2013 TaxID=1280686 RepID=UPI0003F903FD|nr:putative manganese-dependent inorganic diphosphatase [Butyrivibrio sp. MC2013]